MSPAEQQALCDALAAAHERYGHFRRHRPDATPWPAVWAWGTLSASLDRLTLGAVRRTLLSGAA